MVLKRNKTITKNRYLYPIVVVLVLLNVGSALDTMAQGSDKKIQFRTHIIDDSLIGGSFSNTGVADMDGDEGLEYIMSSRGTKMIYVYKFHEPGHWSKYIVGENPPTDAGGTVLDVDGDGNNTNWDLSCHCQKVNQAGRPMLPYHGWKI